MSLTNGAKHEVAISLFEEIVLPFVMSQEEVISIGGSLIPRHFIYWIDFFKNIRHR